MVSRQLRLHPAPVDERTLDVVARTVLEAIDEHGLITARQAGEIVYRFRGFEHLLAIPKPWFTSAGRQVLQRLERLGLVRHRCGRWWRKR